MSRTVLCVCAALSVALASAALMVARAKVMGDGPGAAEATATATDWKRQLFQAASVDGLPRFEKDLVEVLLLFPAAALVIALFRQFVGLTTFGTFAPALLGLAFRDPAGWPGILVFIGVILAGWLLRRALDRLHLLQVPRVSVLLCVVVSFLAVFVVASHRFGWSATRHVSLFPLVVLTGMIERFWTLEEEDGTRASFLTLASTLLVAACVSFVIGRPALGRFVLAYPESVGLIVAVLLLLGRYTGYRLTELYRYRELLRQPEAPEAPDGPVEVWSGRGSFGPTRF